MLNDIIYPKYKNYKNPLINYLLYLDHFHMHARVYSKRKLKKNL